MLHGPGFESATFVLVFVITYYGVQAVSGRCEVVE
jgi:hypothetical protein